MSTGILEIKARRIGSPPKIFCVSVTKSTNPTALSGSITVGGAIPFGLLSEGKAQERIIGLIAPSKG